MWDSIDTLIANGLTPSGVEKIVSDLLIADEIDVDDARCLVALAWHAEGDDFLISDIEFERATIVKIDGESYRVLTEDERDDAWDEALEQYGSEHVPGYNDTYFNREAWKKDARTDGAEHFLSSDGNYHEYCVSRPHDDNSWWFLYKVG